MEELPLLDRLQRLHKDRGFLVVAINIVPEQNREAVRLIRRRGYSFTALAVPDERWIERHGIEIAPGNVLVDRAGRTVLEPSFYPAEARRFSEREIETLVARH